MSTPWPPSLGRLKAGAIRESRKSRESLSTILRLLSSIHCHYSRPGIALGRVLHQHPRARTRLHTPAFVLQTLKL